MKPFARLFALFSALALLLPSCVTVRDCDGNRCRTLKINGMRWMAENLRTTHYADGSPIVIGEVADKEATGACYFDDWNSQDSVRKYGLLYTWAAAVRDTGMTTASVQGVCPDGWHLPNDAEWTAMTQGCVAEGYQYRIPFSAKNMRIIKRFVRPPRSGYRYPGNYTKVGEESFWWSSTPSSDGTQEQHYIHSKHQRHVQEEFDTANTYNYTELARTESAKTSYLGVVYDSYRNLYYIIVSRPMPYENRDGTRNNISDKPWSLLVLDSAFRQIAEMDIPDCLSKHELMVVPKGIALADKRLSDDEKTCFVILRYNEKDLYNTDIAAVRRHSRGANKRK